jgi:hypothetical protein
MSRAGLPRASPAVWIFVLKPPDTGQGPGHRPPFLPACARRVLMRSNDGGVDHQPLQIGFALQCRGNFVRMIRGTLLLSLARKLMTPEDHQGSSFPSETFRQQELSLSSI